jgi:hypothetical protein
MLLKLIPFPKRLACWAGAALLLAWQPVQASLIAYDSFDTYTSGTALNSTSGGTGWATNWSTVANVTAATPGSSLSYSNGAVSLSGGPRVAQIGNASNGDNQASRTFASQTGTLYFSFLFNLNTSLGASDNDFIQFSLNNDTNIANSGSIGDLSNSPGINTFSARIGGTSGGTTAQSTTTIGNSTTYFLVGKMSKVSASTTYNRMDLFINPNSLTEPGTTDATQTLTSSGNTAVSFFTLRTDSIDSTDLYWFDELRIGTTWADVVAAPEPAAWALLLGGLGMLAVLRRRRG